ncbi:MAG: PQQ-binding-like beta-propeller repeat protein, partial [Bacteroidales bacterium]|nr:PQQ-binding-like beta-propeller repeat protein [Bacteroidales bacterium]
MKNKILLCVCCVFVFVTVSAQEQENWPRFRGPNGQGISNAKDLPVRWSAEENIAWKTNIPGEAWSSPIVWNDHVFLTTTTEDGKNCHVIAVNTRTGKILWDKIVFTQKPQQHKHEMNSYATPTPVTDGNTVFAVFS